MSQSEPTSVASRPSWILFFALVLTAVGVAKQGSNVNDDEEVPGENHTTSYIPTGMPSSNGRMIAVSGIDVTGASILYVIDTQDPHLAVYQANGGSGSTQGVELVGARRIDLDLKLDGFNDKSEESFKSLQEKFIRGNLLPDKDR